MRSKYAFQIRDKFLVWSIATGVLRVFLLGLILLGRGEAAEWSIVPSLGVKGVYNDNLLLTTLPHNATYGYWVSPAAEFSGKTERLEINSKVASDFVSYYGGEVTNFTNLHFPLAVRYRTEQDQLGFTGGFVRDNTLISELLTTGLVLRFTQRNQWTADPTWTRQLTEKLSFQASGQMSDTTYENGTDFGLVNYQLFGGSGGLLYQATEQDQIQLIGSYVDFHTTNAPSALRASLSGVNAHYTHAFHESLTGTIYAGPRFIRSTSHLGDIDLTTHDTVWLYGGNIAKKFENTTAQISVSRDILPSGAGLLIQTDRVGVKISHDLTEALAAAIDTGGYRVTGATSTASGGSIPEQKYFYVSPRITWKFLAWWKAELSYSHRFREIQGSSANATSNAAMFTITYYPPKLSCSN